MTPFKSEEVLGGPARAPHRSLLRALGVGRGDEGKPIIGIANSYSELLLFESEYGYGDDGCCSCDSRCVVIRLATWETA